MPDDWISVLQGPDYRWEDRQPPALPGDFEALERYIRRTLPDDYVELLSFANGGGLWYKDEWFLRLWRAQDIPDWSAAYGFVPRNIAGAVAIGSDGGGEGLVLDIRPERPNKQYPLYLINFVSLDWDEAYYVAPDVHSLLLRHRGLFER